LRKVRSVVDIQNGYALDFGPAGDPDSPETAALLKSLGEFISQERSCCPFFDYSLQVTRDGGPVVLSFWGSDAAKPIADEVARAIESASVAGAETKTSASRPGSAPVAQMPAAAPSTDR
jgi:hypothetical protein